MATIIERIGKTGKPSYRVQIRHHSKFLKTMNTNHTLGKTFRTREEARAWADAQEQESKALTSSSSNAPKIIHISERQAFGVLTDFSPPLLANTSSLPFSRIIERYEREIQPHKAAKTQSGQTYLLNYWKKQLGNIPLNKITTALLATEKDRLFQLGIQGPTVRRYLITLHNVLQVAMKQWQLLSSNPATALQKPPDSKGRTRFLSHKEINVLLAKCKANHHYQLYPIVVIALSTEPAIKRFSRYPSSTSILSAI